MATLTVSTNGMGKRALAGTDETTPECHKVEDIEHIRYVAGAFDRNLAVLTLDAHQALGIAYDLLYQAVDAGVITGWHVQHADG